MIQFTNRISSRQNAVVARYRQAARRGLVLLDGPHLIGDALAAGITIRHAMIASEALERPAIAALGRQLQDQRVELAEVTAPVLAAASPVRSPGGIVALADRPAAGGGRAYRGDSSLVIIACDVQDPGNLGAIARVAEAAGATGLVAAGACADPFGWKALRGSMGSALRLPITITDRIEPALAEARRRSCRLAAAMPRDGDSPFTADLSLPLALLIGGEGSGLPAEALADLDVRLSIPMQPPVESLNVAVTAALILYEVQRQQRALHTRRAQPDVEGP